MSEWDYYDKAGWLWPGPLEPGQLTDSDTVETVGPSELPLMRRARASANGALTLIHGRNANRARLAARRLVLRELLTHRVLGSARFGYLHLYQLTDRGRTCWLRARR